MKTKTVELDPSQVKVTYLDDKGNVATGTCKRHLFRVELGSGDINPDMVIRVRFPELDSGAEDGKDAKVKVTYIEPSVRDLKYMGKLKNWISPK